MPTRSEFSLFPRLSLVVHETVLGVYLKREGTQVYHMHRGMVWRERGPTRRGLKMLGRGRELEMSGLSLGSV